MKRLLISIAAILTFLTPQIASACGIYTSLAPCAYNTPYPNNSIYTTPYSPLAIPLLPITLAASIPATIAAATIYPFGVETIYPITYRPRYHYPNYLPRYYVFPRYYIPRPYYPRY